MFVLRITLLLLILASTLAAAQGNGNAGGKKPKSVKTDEVYYLLPDADQAEPQPSDGEVQAAAAPGGGGGGGSGPDPYHETYARQNIREDVTPYGVDLLGEQFDLATGTLSFNHTDVSLPGNNGLEVAIRRTLSTAQTIRFRPVNEFGDWELDVPKLEMLVSANSSPLWKNNRCTGQSTPNDIFYYGTIYFAWEYWNGLKMHIPGRGVQTVLDYPRAPLKSGGNVKKSTTQYWDIECGNIGGSETFIATSPNGIRYHFTKLRYLAASGVLKNFKMMDRKRAQMLATRVEDRFGNFVNYNYTGSQLTSIVASDGRQIDIDYGGNGHVSKVTVNGREWTYGYSTYTGYAYDFLTSVTLPDGASWSFENLYKLVMAEPYDGLLLAYGCNSRRTATGTVTHPYGAKGTYTLTETAHGRTDVPKRTNLNNPSCTEHYHIQRSFDVLSLTQKKLEGPGMPTYTWNYSYSENAGGWAGDGTNPLKTTRVDKPDGSYDIHHFNRSWSYLEGAEVKHETYNASGALLQRVEYDYEAGPYRGTVGELLLENLAKNQTPKHRTEVVTTRGTDVYTTLYDFNTNTSSPTFSFGRPIQIDQSNSFTSYSKVEDIAYLHDKTHWELGRETTRKVGTETISENVYDANNRVWKQKQYSVEVREFSYNTDGTVAWQEDALDNRITLANWKRGIPQLITYPDTTTHAFAVDNNGWITSSTDRKTQTTAYGHDSMGRIDLVDYPDEPGLTRANKVLSLSKVTAANDGLSGSGIAVGQYKHVKTRGELKVTTYLDALFRPVLTRSQHTTDSTQDRFSATTYDFNSQPTFGSFPSASLPITDGTDTVYDALRRVIEVEENVTPYAKTSYAYQNGNKVQVTNPRNKVTTTTYFALGSPDQSAPTLIVQPESVTTTIARNNFGEMTSATQSGGGVSATRTYRYDSSHRLCRQVDPETGSTAYSYNNANQLVWYALAASGGTAACNLSSVPTSQRVLHTYDTLGRLKTVNYPDSSPDLTYDYDDNGNLWKLNSSSANWTYAYNKVNGLIQEDLVTGGQTFTTDYGFDTMDRLDRITYPGGTAINITPNAYGEPEAVGSYASGIDYWPNGSIKELDYGTQQGTGRQHTTTQNARQLPEKLKVVLGAATLADLTHAYDANANITGITDAVNGTGFDRSMGYDDIDRLTTASGFWGAGSYTFDAVGNILTKIESDIDLDYTYNSTTNRLTSIDDSYDNADYAFSYDSVGNVTHNGNQGFTYNLAGNMVSSTNPGITYKYDGHKRRVQKDDGSQIGYTVYGQNGKLMHKLKGGVSTHYVYAGSLLIAELQGSTVNYVHTDLLGSPIKGDNGTAYAEHYRPWGEKKDHPIQLADDVGYTGHQDDVATGLTYMQARYYDPVVGRFMATDPVQFDGSNVAQFGRYSYAIGNPFKYVDPDGKEPTLNMFPRNEQIYHNAQKIPDPPPGVVSVAGHGTPNRMERRFSQRLDARRVADIIRALPEFKGAKKIVLLSCNVGKGEDSLAQQVAVELGMPVEAPNKFIFIDSNGDITIADPLPESVNPENEFDLRNAVPDPDNLGEFVEFQPK